MKTPSEYTGPRLRVRAVKVFCHNCRKTAWFHKRLHKRWVCRGDISPQMMAEGVTPTSKYIGCGHEYPINGTDCCS